MSADVTESPQRRGLTPVRLRGVLERLGPTFIKIGQYLALRPDILDQSYCNELLKLVDRVAADPLPVMQQILREDLGGDIDAHFSWFAARPIASGSLAQVYEARTLDGDPVAVKVLHAGARERVERDLRRLGSLLRLLKRTGILPDLLAGELSEELRRWMHDELDFDREFTNLNRMHRLARDSAVMVVPQPWASLSAGRVLTMDLVRGIPFSVILRQLREGEPRAAQRAGFDRRELARGLIEAMLEQIFVFHLFHADIHPGNVIALPGDRVGFVDFGLVETLEPGLEAGLFRYVRAIYGNNTEEMLRGLDAILVPGEWADVRGFRRDFLEENRRWQLERNRLDAAPPLGHYMIAVVRVARRHDFRLPIGILAIYRSLLTAETVAMQMASDVDLTSVGRDFFNRLEQQIALRLPSPQALQSGALELIEMLREAPRKIDRILSDIVSDRFRLRVEEVTSLTDRRLRSDQVRLIAAALIWVGFAVLLGVARNLTIGWLPVPAVLGTALVVNALWLVLLWRRLP
jgi:ubiquinone biosynthesis protein